FAALVWLIPWFLVFPRRMGAVSNGLASRPRATSSVTSWRALANRNLLGICLGFFCFDYYWYVLVTWLPDYLVAVRHLRIVQAGFYASDVFYIFGLDVSQGGWIAISLIR